MVLVDTSVWIEYFKGSPRAAVLNDLIDSNNIWLNDLILSELIPSINHKKENSLKEMLFCITRSDLHINWNQIIYMQTQNLQHGINNVGIPDLIILQNAIDNNLQFFSYDKHFKLMADLFGLRLLD